MIFLSLQQMCGIVQIPVSSNTFSPISTESARVLPEGESGKVIAFTWMPVSWFAASISFWSSAINGGASSTVISLFALLPA